MLDLPLYISYYKLAAKIHIVTTWWRERDTGLLTELLQTVNTYNNHYPDQGIDLSSVGLPNHNQQYHLCVRLLHLWKYRQVLCKTNTPPTLGHLYVLITTQAHLQFNKHIILF